MAQARRASRASGSVPRRRRGPRAREWIRRRRSKPAAARRRRRWRSRSSSARARSSPRWARRPYGAGRTASPRGRTPRGRARRAAARAVRARRRSGRGRRRARRPRTRRPPPHRPSTATRTQSSHRIDVTGVVQVDRRAELVGQRERQALVPARDARRGLVVDVRDAAEVSRGHAVGGARARDLDAREDRLARARRNVDRVEEVLGARRPLCAPAASSASTVSIAAASSSCVVPMPPRGSRRP